MALCGHFVHPQGAQQVEPVTREGSVVSLLWVPFVACAVGRAKFRGMSHTQQTQGQEEMTVPRVCQGRWVLSLR